MIELFLIFNLSQPPIIAAATPTEIAQEMMESVTNSYNWLTEYIFAVLGLLTGSALLGFWLKTWR